MDAPCGRTGIRNLVRWMFMFASSQFWNRLSLEKMTASSLGRIFIFGKKVDSTSQYTSTLVTMALVASVPSECIQWSKEQDEDNVTVFLKIWDGKTLCCIISPSMAPASILGLLEQRVVQFYADESKKNFYFTSQGKPLNEHTLPVLAWQDGTTIFVQYRNRGGCFLFSFIILTIILIAVISSVCTCGLSLMVVPVLLPLLFILPLFCL